MSPRLRKILLRSTLAGTLALAALTGGSHLAVESAGDGRCHDKAEEVPFREVAMVLGCPKSDSWTGKPNAYYWNRVNAAAALFKAGKCRKIIVSSDVDAPAMLEDVRAAGVPGDRLVADPLGVRTYDSMVRARVVFGVREGIVVSQRYHNERAIYLGKSDGSDWIGFDAEEDSGHSWLRAHARELLARVKAVLDVHCGAAAPVSLQPVAGGRPVAPAP